MMRHPLYTSSFSIMRKRILPTVAFVLVLTLVIFGVSRFLERKVSRDRYTDYIQSEEPLDVMFFGSSHAYYTWIPMVLWNEYGIASYNMGNPTERISTTYWTMKQAFNEHTPQVAIVDLYVINEVSQKVDWYAEFVHDAWDCFPLSVDKVKAAIDVFEEKENTIETLFPFGMYHSRWNDITSEDFLKGTKRSKGITVNEFTEVVSFESPTLIDDVADVSEMGVGPDYLSRIMDLCDEKNVELIFVYTPHIASEDGQRAVNWVKEMASQRDVEVLDLVREDIVDYAIDMEDDSHLNSSGAQKTTKFLGNYLVNNCNLEDHRQDLTYSSWADASIKYSMLRDEAIAKSDKRENLFVQLNDTEISTAVFMTPDSDWQNDDWIQKLISNIYECEKKELDPGATQLITAWGTISIPDELIGQVCEAIVVYDNNLQKIVLCRLFALSEIRDVEILAYP